MSPRRTDVLVIGGGATGVGVARDCAMRGLDVVLCERDGLGSGTSGRSHGLLHSGARYAVEDPDGARECVEENRILREIAGECVQRTGGYVVQLASDDPGYFDRLHEACESIGMDVGVEPGAAARETVPSLSSSTERVLSVPDAVIYPSRLVAATAESARQHGASIHTHAPVEDLHVEDGAVEGKPVEEEPVDSGAGTEETAALEAIDEGTRAGEMRGEETSDETVADEDAREQRVVGATIGGELGERIDAEYVVNATGAWAGELAAMAGVDVAMRPTRGVMVAVESPDLDVVLNRCRAPSDGDIVVPHEDQAILGTTSVTVDDPDEYPREDWEVERTIEECAAMVPELRDRDRVRTYWGVRPLYEPDEAARAAGGDDAGGGEIEDAGDGEERGISRGFALLDHTNRDGVGGFLTIVGGKLTTHRLMAEAVTDLVSERVGVARDCQTASRSLPDVDDPKRLAALVAEFDAAGPADSDVHQ